MKVHVLFAYTETVIPPRCRKPRAVHFADGHTDLEIREVSGAQAPLAIRAQGFLDYDSTRPYTLDYRWFDDQLWTSMRSCNAAPRAHVSGGQDFAYPSLPDALDLRRKHSHGNESYLFGYWEDHSAHSRNEVLDGLQGFAQQHLLIDGVLHKPANEPRYVVMTFGLGRNHGGTACMVDDGYNGNISKSRYFSLLEREKAIALATSIATQRGDTKNLPIVPHGPSFEVLIPEAIQVRPAAQHGDGDPFLNSLDAMSLATGGSPIVGLVAALSAASEASVAK